MNKSLTLDIGETGVAIKFLPVYQADTLFPWQLLALPPATPAARPWHCISSTNVAKASSSLVNRGLGPQLRLLPRSAAARHGRTELGWARRKPPIGPARKPEGRAVSLLCLAKAASAHPPPDQVWLPI